MKQVIPNTDMTLDVKSSHWYKQHIRECPVCGHHWEWTERIYGVKPKNIEDRIHFEEYYDYCMEQ